MTTQTYSPLSVELARDADATMSEQIDAADHLARMGWEARARKRDAESALKDREAALTLEVIASLGDSKITADLRKAKIDAVLRADPEMRSHRATISGHQYDIDRAEAEHDHALKRWHAAKAVLDHCTAVAHLYANGGRLTS